MQDYANQCSLRTSSWKTFGVGAAISESQDHLPVLEVTKDDSEEPLGDFEGNKDPHDEVMINFIEGF